MKNNLTADTATLIAEKSNFVFNGLVNICKLRCQLNDCWRHQVKCAR